MVTVVVVVTLVGTGVLLAYGSTGVEIATVLALTVAIIGVLVTVASGRGKRSIGAMEIPDEVIVDLARKVLQKERVALSRALGEPGEVTPAKVGFRQPPLVYWHTDGGGRRGSSDEIADYYDNLDRGRLVIAGEPGAGKTVLATCLCIGLARKAIDRPGDTAVPVKLSLLTFNPDGIPHNQPGEIAARLLETWITRSLTDAYGIDADLATRLVTARRVLPVLDGLDEMDASTYLPNRAAELARALNHFSFGELPPFILTSRRDCFNELTKPSSEYDPVPIQHATVVELEPLRMTDVVAYLKHRFHDPVARHRIHPRWRPIVAALRPAGDTPLKQALSVPLYLFLLASAYRAETSNPAEILELSATENIRDRLYQLLIAAGVERNAQTRGFCRDITADQATTWLENLAESIAISRYLGESRINIEIPRIHRIAGRSPGVLTSLLMTIVTLPIFALGWRTTGAMILLYSPILLAFIILLIKGPNIPVTQFSFAQLKNQIRRRQNIVSITLLTTSLGIILFGQNGLSIIGVATCILSFHFLTIGGLRKNHRPGSRGCDDTTDESFFMSLFQRIGAAKSTQLVRSGITATTVNVVILLTGFIPFLHLIGSSASIWFALAGILGPSVMFSPWLLYAMASVTFRFSGRFATRPAQFLDWAQEAGLLGVYGDVLRFRHREFQAWLIKRRISLEVSTSVLAKRL